MAARGRWSVALAGGSTPRLLYRTLADGDPSERIDWPRAQIFFGDERSVPPDHAESNYRMARETLLGRISVPAEQVHRMRGEAADLDGAAAAYEAELRNADPAPVPVIDLVILGMGPDGHTASLFPGTTALDERRRLCVAVDVAKLATRRLTLTYPVFEAAREVMFLIVGQDKAHTLRDAVEGAFRPRDIPCQPILRRAAGAVTIFCDREAATELPTQAPVRPRSRTP
jgi:6-phosphogluconolactonase